MQDQYPKKAHLLAAEMACNLLLPCRAGPPEQEWLGPGCGLSRPLHVPVLASGAGMHRDGAVALLLVNVL